MSCDYFGWFFRWSPNWSDTLSILYSTDPCFLYTIFNIPMTTSWSLAFSFLNCCIRTLSRPPILVTTAARKTAQPASTSDCFARKPVKDTLWFVITSNITQMPRLTRDYFPRETKRHSVSLQPFKTLTISVSNIDSNTEVVL
jgi:hypothetical protein